MPLYPSEKASKSALESAHEAVRLLRADLEPVRPLTNHEVISALSRGFHLLRDTHAPQSELDTLAQEVYLWQFGPQEAWNPARQDAPFLKLHDRFAAGLHEPDDTWYLPPQAETEFAKLFGETHNPILRARYADFLAVRCERQKQNEGARKWTKHAVAAYLQSVKVLSASRETRYRIATFQALDGAAHLALCKAPELLPDVLRELRTFLEAAVQEVEMSEDVPIRYARWAIEVGWILIGLRERRENSVADEELDWWQNEAQRLAQLNEPLDEPFLTQSFWSQTAETARLLKRPADRFAALGALADAKVNEARQRAQGQNASALAAAALMENAVEFFDRLRSRATNAEERTALSEKQRQLKLEIRALYRRGESELSHHEVPFDIDTSQVQASVAQFTEVKTLTESLQRLGASLQPDIDEAQRWADSRKNSELLDIVGVSQMGDGMAGRSYNTPAEKEEFEFNRSIEFQLQLTAGVLIPKIFDALRRDKGLDAAALLAYLDDSSLLAEDNRMMVKLGIKHYFADDFASALHLLVPQLEDVIRHIFEKAGLPPAKPIMRRAPKDKTETVSNSGWEYETGLFLRRVDEVLPGVLPPRTSRLHRAHFDRSLGLESQESHRAWPDYAGGMQPLHGGDRIASLPFVRAV